MPTPATKGKLDATNPIVTRAEQRTKQETVKVVDEGRWSDERTRGMEWAWDAVKGMIRGNGQVGEMSDMVLMAVWEKEVQVGGADELVKEVGRQRDEFVDSRFVEEGKFYVNFRGVVKEEEEEGEEEDVSVKVT